jgi:hypothetical protein
VRGGRSSFKRWIPSSALAKLNACLDKRNLAYPEPALGLTKAVQVCG